VTPYSVDVQGREFVFFFSLGYGAKLLIPIFKHARSWQVLEFIIGFVMLALAISLLV
jgi:L-lysine exporter family protein LysE/ArgO